MWYLGHICAKSGSCTIWKPQMWKAICLAGCAGTCLASQHMGGGNRRSGVHVWSWLYSDAEVNLCSGVNLTISTQANPIAATHHTEWGTGHSITESWEHRAVSCWQWHTLVISGPGRPGQLDSWGLLARQPSQLEFQAQTDRQTQSGQHLKNDNQGHYP